MSFVKSVSPFVVIIATVHAQFETLRSYAQVHIAVTLVAIRL